MSENVTASLAAVNISIFLIPFLVKVEPWRRVLLYRFCCSPICIRGRGEEERGWSLVEAHMRCTTRHPSLQWFMHTHPALALFAIALWAPLLPLSRLSSPPPYVAVALTPLLVHTPQPSLSHSLPLTLSPSSSLRHGPSLLRQLGAGSNESEIAFNGGPVLAGSPAGSDGSQAVRVFLLLYGSWQSPWRRFIIEYFVRSLDSQARGTVKRWWAVVATYTAADGSSISNRVRCEANKEKTKNAEAL